MRQMLAACALVPGIAAAQVAMDGEPRPRHRAEVMVGVLEHGANFHPLGDRLFLPRFPAGTLVEGAEEDGTVDVQFGVRSAPLRFLLKPRLTAKLQVNTDGRTSFASVGAEWRQHAFRGRVYVQGGIGVTVIDGYAFTPDPFAPAIGRDEAWRRYDIYRRRTAFGSLVLFNPNASLGVRLDRRWAAELVWEHHSHRQTFNDLNPGIDHVGLRLVRRLGR